MFRLIVFFLVILPYVGSAQLQTVDNSYLVKSYEPHDRANEVIEIMVAEEQLNPDGTVSANIILVASSRITYGARFVVVEGNVTGSGLQYLLFAEEVAIPLTGRVTQPIGRVTFAPNSRLRVTLNKYGFNSQDTVMLLGYDLLTAMSRVGGGGWLPATSAEGLANLGSQILGLIPFLNLSSIITQVDQGDILGAFRSLVEVLKEQPELFVTYLENRYAIRIAASTIRNAAANVAAFLALREVVLITTDLIRHPETVTVEIDFQSSGSSITGSSVTAPGSYQNEIGCPRMLGVEGDWAPDCTLSVLTDPDEDGIYELRLDNIPIGDYEVKIAIGGSWEENYGMDGRPDGANVPFTVRTDNAAVIFTYNNDTNIVSVVVTMTEPVTIQLPSNLDDNSWFDTGIDLSSQARFSVQAIGNIDIFPNCETAGEPDDFPCSAMRFGPSGSEGIGIADDTFPLPGALVGALIGKIGNQGDPFLIGSGGEFVPQNTGRLYIRINDYWLSDNIGEYIVIVELLSN